MGPRVQGYRSELRGLEDWELYLRKHSGLPGPRANLELVAAVAEEADADRLWRGFGPRGQGFSTWGPPRPGPLPLFQAGAGVQRVGQAAFCPRGGGARGGGGGRPGAWAGGTA